MAEILKAFPVSDDCLKQVGVVVLNWNGWQDTLACLQSLLVVKDIKICIVDNASTDLSVSEIENWLHVNSKYVSSTIITSAEADNIRGDSSRVTLIKHDRNSGFAGGMNIGLMFFMRGTDTEYVWLINNDTEIEPEAPAHLLAAAKADPSVGIWGCKVNWYDRPSEIQVAGGCSFDWARARGIAQRDPDTPKSGPFDYIAGCAMFVPKSFIADVGFISEEYFLYFEEVDWAQRAKGRWSLAWVREAVIYHKEGASIGSSTYARPSDLSLRFITRNRLYFTAKVARSWHNRVRTQIAFELIVYLKRRDFVATGILLRALWQDLVCPIHPI
jgi:GT2 family glycosyltransferase